MECRKNEWQLANEKRKLLPKSEAAKEAGRRYYEKNKEDVKARATARPAIERNRARKAHRLANPEYYKALVSFRRKKHQQATPKWLTYIQKKEIRSLYIVAQTSTRITGVKYVVDHIVPLINNNVCGLHVPWNLQIITKSENRSKGNKA